MTSIVLPTCYSSSDVLFINKITKAWDKDISESWSMLLSHKITLINDFKVTLA